MADLLDVQPGALPWQPAADAELVEVYHRYDVPLIGLVRRHGTTYLFSCVFGVGRRTSIWAYAHLTESEVELIDEVDEAGFERLVQLLLTGRGLVVAIANENTGIGAVYKLSAHDNYGDVLDSLRSILEEFAQQLEQLHDVGRMSESA